MLDADRIAPSLAQSWAANDGILSARAEGAAVESGLRLGADDYLTKPFSRVQLLAAIAAQLG